MSKTYRAWDVDQVWLLPPSVHDFVPQEKRCLEQVSGPFQADDDPLDRGLALGAHLGRGLDLEGGRG